MMELERLKPGQNFVAMADPIKPVNVEPKIVPIIEEVKPEIPVIVAAEPKAEAAPAAVVVKPIPEKPVASASTPAQYFRNFQLFESRVVALSEVGKERLREWAKLFKVGGYKSVTINGYTDNIPPQRLKALYANNTILSEARAKMVADYLLTQGIDSSAVTLKGMGDVNPVASNENEEGRSKNRRIEFVLH